MPNRILRDWTDSFLVHELNADEERFFVRLLMKADDFGRFHGDGKLLNANLFPLHDFERQEVEKWRDKCQQVGLVNVYQDDRGRTFLEVKNFNQRTRQQASKFPDPTRCQSSDGQVTVNARSNDRLDGDGDGDVFGDECGDGTRPAAVHSHAETPSLDEVKAYAATIGLAEWKAVDWWQKQEAVGWMLNNQRIRRWQPLISRVRTFWEADGKPLAPTGKTSSAPTSDAAMPDWVKIKTIEEQLAEHPGNSETVYYRGDPKAKADFKAMKKRLRELKDKQKEQAVA